MTNTTLNAGWTNFYREIARGDCALQFTYTAIEPEHTEYRYNDANELENFVTNIAPAEKFTYDEWGRTITKSRVDGATTYEAVYMYRYGDKLKRVDSTFPNEKDVAYVCDGLGKRRIKSVDPDGTPEKTLYRWAGWSVLAEYGEYTGQGGEWNTFGDRTRTYLGASEVLGSNPQTGTYQYALTDHLGSVRQMRGQDKTLLARHAYYPYGTTLHTVGLPLNRGFTGHQWEPETGQYFAPFRYYNPSAARWTMRDLLQYVDGINIYGYVTGNSVNKVDIYGLYSCTYCIKQHSMDCDASWEVNKQGDSEHYHSNDFFAGNNVHPKHPNAKNNPEKTHVKNTGPLPVGKYDIGPID